MIPLLNYLVVLLFLFMGLIHFYWALGGKFLLDTAIPTKDGKKLLNPGVFLTFVVGFLLLGFAFVVFQINSTDSIYIYLSWVIATIFGIRAIGDFKIVGFFKKIKDTPFAIHDTKYFSPLCLAISISLVAVLLNKY